MTSKPRALSARWQAVKNDNEAAVAAAIIAIVAEDPAELTVAAVCARAGISRQTFYKQFDGLELAVVLTHQRSLLDLHSRISDAVAAGPAPTNGLETVLAGFRGLFTVFTEDPAWLRFTSFYDFSFRVNRLTESEREEHPLVPPIDDHEGPYAAFRAGQRDGSIDPDLPVVTTYQALATSALGTIQRLQIQDDWTDGRDEAARQVYTALLTVWESQLSAHRR